MVLRVTGVEAERSFKKLLQTSGKAWMAGVTVETGRGGPIPREQLVGEVDWE